MQRYRTYSMMLSLGVALVVAAQQPIGSFQPGDPIVGEAAKVVETSSKDTKKGEKLDFESFKRQASQSFQEFADDSRDEMNDFRRQVLENYAKWLEGEWVEFKPEPPKKRYTEPKPSAMPAVNGVSRDLSGLKSTSGLDALRESMGGVTINTQEKNLMGAVNDELLQSFTRSNDTKRIIKDAHYKWSNPDDHTPGDWFSFYDIDVRIPKYDYQIIGSMKLTSDPEDIQKVKKDASAQWVMLDKERVGEVVGAELRKLARQMNLNDYLAYELTRSYVNSKFPNASKMARTALVHYLMMHQGYEARLVLGGERPIIGLPSTQNMYGILSTPIMAGDKACNAWLFDIENEPLSAEMQVNFSYPNIPAGVMGGRTFDFRVNPLNIPKVMKPYDVALGSIELKGELNALLMPIVRKYPQMSTEGFAESILDKEFHDDLIRQVREQFGNLSPLETTNKLLDFIQWGFEYATDDEYHGYEKPYFVEENFF